jgi:hypothetical protein
MSYGGINNMKRKIICLIIISLILTNITPLLLAQTTHYAGVKDIPKTVETSSWKSFYMNSFGVGMDEWDTGALAGPDLWHITDYDSWTDDTSLACFDQYDKNYVNDMYFNWALAPITINVMDEYEMIMEFYCKFITEDISDNWGICLYDPIADEFLPHTHTSLPYDTYGYHPIWMGPMQPIGNYQSFDILEAYNYWYDQGFFRDNNGYQAYDLRVGFMFYESDESGVTNSEALANDLYWSGLLIDDVEIKHIVFNQAPLTPIRPFGENQLKKGFSYGFSTTTTDPDDDTIRFAWDWNGDDVIDHMTSYVNSGESVIVFHEWEEEGIFNVRVKAEDEHGSTSDFSEPLTVTVSINTAPNVPNINGPIKGKAGVEYDYKISSIDPDGDDVYYYIEWFEGCPGVIWDGPYLSGEEITKSRLWEEQGTYTINVKAQDDYGGVSDWATLVVTMPKNKMLIYDLLQLAVNIFPIFQLFIR